MEKETVPTEKGSGLPTPATLKKVDQALAGPENAGSASRRKQFRFLAALVLAVLLGSTAFSFMRRSLDMARLSHFYEELNPDARGRLTVKEAESKFL